MIYQEVKNLKKLCKYVEWSSSFPHFPQAAFPVCVQYVHVLSSLLLYLHEIGVSTLPTDMSENLPMQFSAICDFYENPCDKNSFIGRGVKNAEFATFLKC